MLKRLQATILTLVLVVSMIPVTSFASEGNMDETQLEQSVDEKENPSVPEVTPKTDDSMETIDTEPVETDFIETDSFGTVSAETDSAETDSIGTEQPMIEDPQEETDAPQEVLPTEDTPGPISAGSVSIPATSDQEEVPLGGYSYHFDENIFQITNNLAGGTLSDGFEGSFEYDVTYSDGFKTRISADHDESNNLKIIRITKFWYYEGDPNNHQTFLLYPQLAKEADDHTWYFDCPDPHNDEEIVLQGSLIYDPDMDAYDLNIDEGSIWGFYNMDFLTASKINAEYDDSIGILQVTQYYGQTQVGDTSTLYYGDEVDRLYEDGKITDHYVFTVIPYDTEQITVPFLFYACLSNGEEINLSDKAVVSDDRISYELTASDIQDFSEYDGINIQFVWTEDEFNYYRKHRQQNQIELNIDVEGPWKYTINANYKESEAFVDEAWYKGDGRILFDREKLAAIDGGLPLTFYIDDSAALLTELGYDDRGDELLEIDEAHKSFTVYVTAENDEHNLWIRFGANPDWRSIRFSYDDYEVERVEYCIDKENPSYNEYFRDWEMYKANDGSGDYNHYLRFRFRLREDEHDDWEDPERVTRAFTLNGIKVNKNIYFSDPDYISADEIEYEDGWYYITVADDENDDGLSANYYISTGGDLFINQYQINYSKGQEDGRYHDQNSGKIYTGIKHDNVEQWDWSNPIYYGDKDWRFHYDAGDEILLDLTPPDYLDQKDLQVRVLVYDDNRNLANTIIEPEAVARNQIQWRYCYKTKSNAPLRFDVYWTDAEYAFDQINSEDRQYTVQLTNYGVSNAVIEDDATFVKQSTYQERSRSVFNYAYTEEDDWWNSRKSNPIRIALNAKDGFEDVSPYIISYEGDYRINEEGEAERLHNDHPELEYQVVGNKHYLILDAAACDNNWFNIEITYPYALTYDLNYEGAPAFGTPTCFKDNLRLTDNPDAWEEWAEVMEEGSIPIGENAPTREGYQFGGWYFADGTRCWFMSWNWDEINHSETLYARWNANRYTVEYVVDGLPYTNALNRSEYYFDDDDIALKSPTKAGYVFSGWYEDPAMTKPVDQITAGSMGKKTFYGSFTRSKYTIAFNANGGKGTMVKMTCQCGLSAALKTNAFTRTGYTFAGWSKTADGAIAYKNGASVLNLSTTDGATVTLYAKWTANSYTVKFNANKGKGKMAAKKYTYNKAAALTANKFTRKGYKFTGWSTTKTGKVKYKNKASVKNLVSKNGDSITLYAVWKKK